MEEYERESYLRQYEEDALRLGLWESEAVLCRRYFAPDARILDLGCGAGRTTLGLYRLGIRNLIGVDYSHGMVASCKRLAAKERIPVPFEHGDARSLRFPDASFDGCLFSFNGIMTIPGRKERRRAFSEIARVLRPGGVFVFTTHDRDTMDGYADYWRSAHDRLSEYGDMRIDEVLEGDDAAFLHVPDEAEVLVELSLAGFTLLEHAFRDEIAIENDDIHQRTGNCVFWCAAK